MDTDEDEMAVFEPVLARLDLDLLPKFALSTRLYIEHAVLIGSMEPDLVLPTLTCDVVTPPLSGSYHVVFPLRFSDGARWIIKVPARGHGDQWGAISARSLVAEARTMQLIKRKTTIPIPKVYAFDASLDNEIRVPYIIMEYIDGISLFKTWFDRTISDAALERCRRTILEELAFAMVQLNDFAFDRCGSLEFDEKGDVMGVGHFAVSTKSGHLKPSGLSQSPLNGLGVMEEVVPFADPKTYLRHQVDSRQPPGTNFYKGKEMNKYYRGVYKLIRLFVDWIPLVPHEQELNFVLKFPDFNPQNVLVTSEGRLCGLIDWDGVISKPRYLGCEGYPHWLTRDWDSFIYTYDPEIDKAEQRENSPEELAHYRALYRQYMQRALSQKYRSDQSTFATADSIIEPEVQFSASLTHNSLLIQHLAIAANNDDLTITHLFTIFEKIREATGSDWDNETDLTQPDDSCTMGNSFGVGDDKIISSDEDGDSICTSEATTDLELSEPMFAETTGQAYNDQIDFPNSAIVCSSDGFTHGRTNFKYDISAMKTNESNLWRSMSLGTNMLDLATSSLGLLVDVFRAQNLNAQKISHRLFLALNPGSMKMLDKSKDYLTMLMKTAASKIDFENQNASASLGAVNQRFPEEKELYDKSLKPEAQTPENSLKQVETPIQPIKETTKSLVPTDDHNQVSDEDIEDEPATPPKYDMDTYTGQGFDFWEVTHALADDALDDDRMQRLKEGFMALLA